MTGDQWAAAGIMVGYAAGLALVGALVVVLSSWWWRD